MPVILGEIAFDPAHTAVKETHSEVGGRRERAIEISGFIVGETNVSAIEARLDAILDQASKNDYTAELSIRSGRWLWVRRNEFTRHVSAETLTGAFTLKLGAKDPFEESIALHAVAWQIAASGSTLNVVAGGNANTRPAIRLTAVGDLIRPAFSDGERTIAFDGVVPDGSELAIDGVAGTADLDGENVTPYLIGTFPELTPGETTLTYADDAGSSHTALVSVEYRDRWW